MKVLRRVNARPEPVLTALREALLDDGAPVAPVPPGAAPPPEAHVPEDVVLAVTTSGSTGRPRTVLLGREALLASARATEERLGGPGRWLLCLPVHHVAGLQVLSRSLLAGTEPFLMDPGASFTAEALAAAVEAMDGPRRYASLVPTQLYRALASPAGAAALARLDAVLVGGAATEPALLARAQEAGVRVVRTYGMTETAGGCVYDGVPLAGVEVAVVDSLVEIAGPVLAHGYLGEPDLTAERFRERQGRRWLRTSDLAELRDGVLIVLGRADDVVTTGGVKVAPAAVEAVLAELPGVARACVVGVPDAEWGQAVTAVLVPAEGATVPPLERVRDHVARSLGGPAAPRHLLVLPELPARGPGKTDRRAVQQIAAEAVSRRR